MSCIVPYDRASLACDILIDRESDISEMGSRSYLCHTNLERSLRDSDHFLGIWRDFTDRKHARCIPEVSVDDRRHINIQNITIFQDLIAPRNPVTDDTIQGDTGKTRISALSPAIISLIVNTCGSPTIADRELIHNRIELLCGDTCFHIRPDHIEDIMCQSRRAPNSFDLLWSFYDNFISHSRL